MAIDLNHIDLNHTDLDHINLNNSNDIILPLAPSQHQIWVDQQSWPDSAHLNIGGRSKVYGKLNLPLLEQSLQYLTTQSEALRLCPTADGKQCLVTQWPDKLIKYADLSTVENQEDTLTQMIAEHMKQPFVLDGKNRPWCIYVWQLNHECHALWIKFHHLVMDGFGTSAFFKQWSAIHCALANEQTPAPIDAPSYQSYIDDSLAYLDSSTYQKDAEYWHQALPTLPPAILSKLTKQSKAGQLPLGHHYYELLPRVEYDALTEFAKDNKVTVYHLFIAVVAIYLCRVHNKNEIVMGVPVLNRKGKRFKSTLGTFSAVLPLKVTINNNKNVYQLLSEIAAELRSVYRHTRYPLYHLTKKLDLLNTGRDSMFDVLLSFEPHSYNVYFDQAQLRQPRQLLAANARFPLLVNVCEFHEQAPVELVLEASSDYFTQHETEQTTHRLHHLLLNIINQPEQSLGTLPLLTPQEHKKLLITKHADVLCHTDIKAFINTFEQFALQQPHNIALRWLADGKQKAMDYQTFNMHANRLANELLKQGVKQDIVAVIAPRLPQTIIAFFAVAKIGGAFLPIDPNTDPARMGKMLKHCTSPVTLITQQSLAIAQQLTLKTITIDDANAPLLTQTNTSDQNPNIVIKPDSAAVVLFTSGSTGDPKGVVMTHSGLAKRMAWLGRNVNFGVDDIALQSIQLTFDPCLMEILLPLTHGGSLALPPAETLAPGKIAYYAELFGATYFSTVPTLLRYFCQTAKNHPKLKIKAVGCGGERLTKQIAQEFTDQTGAQVYNFWGLTETTIFASYYRFDGETCSDQVPIGLPIDDSRLYVLDKYLQPLPKGVTGEIYVGGSAIASGYLNEPQLTAKKYITDPFSSNGKMFKSGDLGYWDHNEQLQFVSRIDNMLKVRGQRVEPSQVEAALCQLCFIEGAAVKLVNEQLQGWIELTESTTNKTQLTNIAQNIKTSLLKTLPAYMVPIDFTLVKTLPRQPGGKLDYKALVADPIANITEQAINKTTCQPETPIEQLLLTLWRDTLKIENLHVNSDFFQCGGDSLGALQLLTGVESQLGYRLPLATMLQHPTVSTLAQALANKSPTLQINLSEHQQGTCIYLAASGHGDALRFKLLAKALGQHFHIKMLQPPITSSGDAFDTLEQLASQYAKLITTNHHDTPPILAGFSVGGISILETANALIDLDFTFNNIILIDSTYPNWFVRRTPIWQVAGWLVKRLGLQELNVNQRSLGSLFSDNGLNSQINALRHYQPKSLSQPITLVASSGLKRWYYFLLKPWRKLLGEQLNEVTIPGFHGSLFTEKHVNGLAEIFTRLTRLTKGNKKH
ncbi:non-ribosomal peptide synthetase [Algibacillus agarilyticus]|uniref:non-ribosomal peptide synthetase n=1 Tax=Algibacillus agarilyticus TaxID=2234133 RepID=UPI0018E55881|nr:non-ribosomal peptide synthetase [Algibacillus agarilyticus]